jgi:hypothetical protein
MAMEIQSMFGAIVGSDPPAACGIRPVFTVLLLRTTYLPSANAHKIDNFQTKTGSTPPPAGLKRNTSTREAIWQTGIPS